jgi:hypothetical protein
MSGIQTHYFSGCIYSYLCNQGVKVSVIVFNITFNNISTISWWSVLLVEKTGLPKENHAKKKIDKLTFILDSSQLHVE